MNNISSIGAFLSQEMDHGEGALGHREGAEEAELSRFTDELVLTGGANQKGASGLKEAIGGGWRQRPYGEDAYGGEAGGLGGRSVVDDRIERSESYGSLLQS